MNYFAIAKLIAPPIVGLGAGVVVKNIIVATTPQNITAVQKALVMIGAFGLSGIVTKAASNYTTEEIEELEELYKSFKESANLAASIESVDES